MQIRFSVPCLIVAFLLNPISSARAAWWYDGNAVCTAPGDQYSPVAVSDGAGGAIIAWMDYRAGAGADIYARRVDAAGNMLWGANGVAVCTAVNNQSYPKITSDGAGGAIITWADERYGSDTRVFARRVDASGNVLWTADGVALCPPTSYQYEPHIVSDGAGGAIVAWDDFRGLSYEVYAQRINASGTLLWGSGGAPIAATVNHQWQSRITADGVGGAVIAWRDERSGPNTDVYAQRVNASGAALWTLNGVNMCTAVGDQLQPELVSDGAGGAVVVWIDYRGGNQNLYAGRVNASGSLLWSPDGVPLTTAPGTQDYPAIVSDGAGGAIVGWYDGRSGTSTDVYARRVDALGNTLWMTDGFPVCAAADYQSPPTLVPDGAGGAIFTWSDNRSSAISADVYAQRVDALGNARWTTDGVPLCMAPGNQAVGPIAASDGTGGMIISWFDQRGGSSGDVYVQRIEPRYGYYGHPEPTLTAARDNPKDQGGKVILNWTASGRDMLNEQVISKYTIWRGMDVAPVAPLASAHSVTVVDEPVTASARPGDLVVWHEHTAVTDYYWELVGTQAAYYNAAYSFTAPTRQDSTLGNPATQYFRIAAEGYNAFYNWPSNALSAHSVDNLAPAAPLYLTALRAGPNVNLKWNRVRVSDLKNYSVYRKTSSGVTPVPLNFLASATDTVLVDAGAPGSALYYIVTAKDVHENQGPASNEASVGATTNVGNTPALTTLSVLQNHPNPFTGSTELEIGLPEAARIEVEVYDVSGARVSVQTIAGAKGWQKVPFAAVDENGKPLSSGVYFYKVHARGQTVTRKMVIAR